MHHGRVVSLVEAELRLILRCLHLSYCCELVNLGVIRHTSSPSLLGLLLLVEVGLRYVSILVVRRPLRDN